MPEPSYSSSSSSSSKRQFEFDNNSNDSNTSNGSDKRRKKRSRWGGDESEKVFIPGLPTILPANLSKEQEEIYICKLTINYRSNN